MIRYASDKDFPTLKNHDKHIDEAELINSIKKKRILIMFDNNIFIGWLRFNLFWDNTPFMNMLFIIEEYRGKGNGRKLISYWEKEMREHKYKIVMTSTRSDEQAQFFYRENGYSDCGSLLLPNEPLEIILMKNLI